MKQTELRDIPLPAHLQNAIRVNWHITSWCNYSCEYCPVEVFHQRSKSRDTQNHSFDYRPVADWLAIFDALPYRNIHFIISGGEPFLDRKNFRELLAGLTGTGRMNVSVCTNGYWDPKYYDGIDKSSISLTVAYHPTQVSFTEFRNNVLRIRESGFNIAMINFVLAPENIDDFDEVFHTLEGDGFLVNVSAMLSAGVYMSRTDRTERELDLLERYNSPTDNYFKLGKPVVKNRPCFYPAMTYSLMYDGSIRTACTEETARNLFTDGLPEALRHAVPCQHEVCIGCTEMYRALVNEPTVTTPLNFFSSQDYADEVRRHRRRYARSERLRKLPLGLGKLLGQDSRRLPVRAMLQNRSNKAAPELIQIHTVGAPLPLEPLFGHIDQNRIAARSRDRISVSGWVATNNTNTTVREVRIKVNGFEVAALRDLFERPDIAETYGRVELIRSGWRGMVYLPALPHGDHELIAVACDSEGTSMQIAAARVVIFD